MGTFSLSTNITFGAALTVLLCLWSRSHGSSSLWSDLAEHSRACGQNEHINLYSCCNLNLTYWGPSAIRNVDKRKCSWTLNYVNASREHQWCSHIDVCLLIRRHSAESITTDDSGNRKTVRLIVDGRDVCNQTVCPPKQCFNTSKGQTKIETSGPIEFFAVFMPDPCDGQLTVRPMNPAVSELFRIFPIAERGQSYSSRKDLLQKVTKPPVTTRSLPAEEALKTTVSASSTRSNRALTQKSSTHSNPAHVTELDLPFFSSVASHAITKTAYPLELLDVLEPLTDAKPSEVSSPFQVHSTSATPFHPSVAFSAAQNYYKEDNKNIKEADSSKLTKTASVVRNSTLKILGPSVKEPLSLGGSIQGVTTRKQVSSTTAAATGGELGQRDANTFQTVSTMTFESTVQQTTADPRIQQHPKHDIQTALRRPDPIPDTQNVNDANQWIDDPVDLILIIGLLTLTFIGMPIGIGFGYYCCCLRKRRRRGRNEAYAMEETFNGGGKRHAEFGAVFGGESPAATLTNIHLETDSQLYDDSQTSMPVVRRKPTEPTNSIFNL